MKNYMQKLTAAILVLTILFSQILLFPVSAAEDDPVLTMSIANKIDVALAVGPTSVDYSTFEADLRKALKEGREHPVPDEDVYIMASQAVSANTTAEFSWWTYDHTRPSGTEYNGVANISDTTHMYSELSVAATTTASATNLQNGTGVNYAPGVWGPGLPTTVTAIVTTVGAANYVPGIGYQYADVNNAVNNKGFSYPNPNFVLNPDSTNPDLAFYNTTNTRRLRHPYEGNNTHMVSSNNGATMDFYGYPQQAYRDWQYLPNDQKTLKTFEFSIAEDRAFDALDGMGFFFNTEVNGSYSAGTQTMSGYLLFLQYTSSGVGGSMTIYKFKDVNTKNFHHAVTGATTSGVQYTVAGYNGTANATSTTYKPQFIPVASSTIYAAGDFSRRIRVEASPTNVKVYYKGSTNKNDAAVLDPAALGYRELSDLNLVNFNTASLSVTGLGTVTLQRGTAIEMDPNYIGPNKLANEAYYGFGPMAAYLPHGCARPTHIALQNLSMTVEKVKSLTEVVREPDWHENTIKYLVNLNEHKIDDFEENAIIAELLSRLTGDDIYYIGWGSTINAIASAAFLTKHSLKGAIIDIDDLENLYDTAEWTELNSATQVTYLKCIQEKPSYDAQIKAIADEIYKRYWGDEAGEHALVSDTVHMNVNGADMQNTADGLWPDGKWMIQHIIKESFIEIGGDTFMTNFEGIYPDSGKYMEDLEPSYNFALPGLYLIYYRDFQVGELTVHRKPVASFDVTLDGGAPAFINTSYDPDIYAPKNPEINGGKTGIKTATWTWIDLSADSEMLAPEEGIPPILEEGRIYLVTLTVEDDWGATDSISREIVYGEIGSQIFPPYGDFTLTPTLFIKTNNPSAQALQTITLTNKSYDPAGLPITSAWTVYKDDVLYPAFSITEAKDFAGGNIAQITVGTLPAGRYKIVLSVTNNDGKGGSEISAPVAKFFDIVEDLTPPAAKISETPPQTYTGNKTLALTFSDAGGSGFKEARFAIVTKNAGDPAPSAPVSGSAEWKAVSPSVTRSVLINIAGDNYVFWEAWDNAGNYASGVFGRYTMTKKDINMNLAATPQDGVGAVYDAPNKGVTLTATLTRRDSEDPLPVGTVIFYQGSVPIGSGNVNSAGVAALNISALSAENPATFTAVYSGDANYTSQTASDTCAVAKNPDASITIGEQLNRQYNGTAYTPSDIILIPAIAYKMIYTGVERNGTTYGPSSAAPANAGIYTVTVTTDDNNYITQSDSANFEILPRELVLHLDADPPDESDALNTVILYGTISNAIEIPPGSLKFFVDGVSTGVLIATVESKDFDNKGSGIYSAAAEWVESVSGPHTLTLEYIPSQTDTDNYIAIDYVIDEYDIDKLNQTISFTDSSPVAKTFGDPDFSVSAELVGIGSAETISYILISGSDIVLFDPDTGNVTILAAGTATIRAIKPGDSTFNPATAEIEININKKAGNLKIFQADVEFGETVSPVVIENDSAGIVTYSYEGIDKTGKTYGPSDIPPTAVGVYTVTGTVEATDNYTSVNDFALFSIIPCECEITGIDFKGATVCIPYYAAQQSYDLTAAADFVSCDRSGHNYSFTYSYEICGIDPSGSISGKAVINSSADQLIVNNNAVGYKIEVQVTATHVPTGITRVESAYIIVEKGLPPDAFNPDESNGEGMIDKNEDETVEVDISTIFDDEFKLTYIDGPDGNSSLKGVMLELDTDYDINDAIIKFLKDFVSDLYAGEHEFEFESGGGNKLKFKLYIAFGDVIVDFTADSAVPNTSADLDVLKETETNDEDNKEELNRGYDIFIELVISKAGASAGGASETDLIQKKTGTKAIGAIFDISLIKKTRNENSEILKNTNAPIRFVMDIPQEIQGMKNYAVARAHTADTEGGDIEYELLPANLIGDNQLEFFSDKFSTFAILYDQNLYDKNDKNTSDKIPPPPPLPDPSVKLPDNPAGDPDPANNPPAGQPGNLPGGKIPLSASNANSADPILSGNKNYEASEKIKTIFETDEHIKYINGYEDKTIRPDHAITRAEVAAIFYRLLKNPPKNHAVHTIFTDVPDHAWYAQSVNYLAEMGILKGYFDGAFKPNQFITRAEFTAIVTRFDDLEENVQNPFKDITQDYWAYKNILSAYNRNWINGYPNGEFKPQENITRAEVITIVNKMLGRKIDIKDLPEELYLLYSVYSDLSEDHWAFSDIIEASVTHKYTKKSNGYETWPDQYMKISVYGFNKFFVRSYNK